MHPALSAACAILLAGATLPALATNDGELDGIYECQARLSGQIYPAFISLNGKADGKTIYVVAADSTSALPLYGYGLGVISGQDYRGDTSAGKRFAFVFTLPAPDADGLYDRASFTGTMGLTGTDGKAVNAVLNCNSIW